MSFNVFVTRTIPEPGLKILREHCETVDVFQPDRVMKHEEILEAVKGRDGIICLLTDTIDRDILNAADKTRAIANYAVGYNNIDTAAATDRKIIVTNTPGVLTNATAEIAWALLFSVTRRIVESDTYVRTGKFKGWGPMLFLGGDVTGKTLGIIGAGRIGTAMAERAAGFKMKIIYFDNRQKSDFEKLTGAEYVDFKTLLKQSDFISLHVPLSDQTRHLFGNDEFTLMKETAYLINTSRGPVVDERALVEALKNHTIAGAGLDVFENEPAVDPGLLTLDNVVMTPHTGSGTFEARTKMSVMAAENLIAALNGQRPPNIVNPQVLD